MLQDLPFAVHLLIGATHKREGCITWAQSGGTGHRDKFITWARTILGRSMQRGWLGKQARHVLLCIFGFLFPFYFI